MRWFPANLATSNSEDPMMFLPERGRPHKAARRRISEKVFGRRNEFFADFFGGYALMKPRFF